METSSNETRCVAAAPARKEAVKLRVLTAAAVMLMVGAAVFLRHWGDLQRVGVPGVKVVRDDLRLMPEKVDATTTLESLQVIATNVVALPQRVPGYQAVEMPLQRIVYDTLPKDTVYGQRMFVAEDGLRIQNTVVLMGTDRTSIHKPEFCLEGSGFQIVKAEEVRIPMARPLAYELPAMKMTIRQEKTVNGKPVVTEGIYLFWFVSGDKLTARHRERMWWMARDLLTQGELQRWAYVIAFGIGQEGETGRNDAIYGRLVEFVQATVPEYQLVPGPERTTASVD